MGQTLVKLMEPQRTCTEKMYLCIERSKKNKMQKGKNTKDLKKNQNVKNEICLAKKA